eukprot:scaffold17793_cov131-Isochrysis_galbana.AAC.14
MFAPSGVPLVPGAMTSPHGARHAFSTCIPASSRKTAPTRKFQGARMSTISCGLMDPVASSSHWRARRAEEE